MYTRLKQCGCGAFSCLKRALKRQKKLNLKKKSFDFGFLEKIKFLKRKKSFDFFLEQRESSSGRSQGNDGGGNYQVMNPFKSQRSLGLFYVLFVVFDSVVNQ